MRPLSAYVPAYLEVGGALNPAWLVLFPPAGPDSRVPLRPGLAGGFYFLASSSDGRALYGVSPGGDYGGLKKLEFNPVRESVVPGSAGLDFITSLAASAVSDRLFVAASTRASGRVKCGDFEVDPAAGSFRVLRLGAAPDCGGPVSPGGRFELHGAAGQLGLLDLTAGADTPLGTGMKWATWSPDGRWIAAIFNKSGAGTVVMIDASNPAKVRRLGAGEGPLRWSPDSRYLLLERPQLACRLTLYGVSLQVIDIETGKRSLVKSSKCKISAGSFFWVDSSAMW